MSQNDLVIANQSFPATRADINSALQALGSLNSGSTAPATTYANMLWYDTANNTLKMRSEADDAWIDLGVLNQSSLSFAPANAVPIGAVNTFAMNSAPSGWLSCDGSAVSRTTYSGLFSAVGTTYGTGDGSTTFNVPDLRGEFVRGLDNGRGVDSGRTLGSAQLDQMQRITGDANSSDIGGFIRSGQGTVSGALVRGSAMANGLQGTSGFQSAKLGFDSASSPNARTSATTDGETRPRNIALLYCIKY